MGNVVPRSDEDKVNLDGTVLPDDEFGSGSGDENFLTHTTELPDITTYPYIPTTSQPPELPPPTCCENVTKGLCQWIEPENSPLLEDLYDIKDMAWTNEDCEEIHPDNIKEIEKRFKACKARDLAIKRNQESTTAKAALGGSDKVLSVLVKQQDETNDGIKIDTPNLKAVAVKRKPGSGGKMGAFDVPLDKNSNATGAKMTTMGNPYVFVDSASRVQSNVQSLSLTDDSGKELKVNNTKEKIQLWINGKGKINPPVEKHVSHDNMSFYPINLTSEGMSIHALIYPKDPNERFEVYLKYGGDKQLVPTKKDHDFVLVIPRDVSLIIANKTLTAAEINQLKYTFFPPTNLTAKNGSYVIGVAIYGAYVKMEEAKSGSFRRNFTFSFQIFMSGCIFWSEEEDTWSSEGCEVGPLTTKYRTQCLCNHLTSFGGDFVVPPNTIDFKNVWGNFSNLSENAAVFSTVIVLLGLYVIILIWCRYQDKKDILKVIQFSSYRLMKSTIKMFSSGVQHH